MLPVFTLMVWIWIQEVERENGKLRDEADDLSHRCRSHEQTINKFLSQFKELQSEMKQLVSLHTEQTAVSLYTE